MIYGALDNSNREEIEELFTSVFSSSEGEREGQLIGRLSSQLASAIDNNDIICFGVREKEMLIGTIFFTRLYFRKAIQIFMLAPVAVSTEYQGQGIGQALIKHGLHELRNHSVSAVVTYGDPSFYSKVGFQALSENVIQAPLKLSMPFGWLGQSLTGDPIAAINERPVCVKEFNNPIYW
jgi:putative acetyltransferase